MMKVVSTETNLNICNLPGLSQDYELSIHTEAEVSEEDGLILLTLPGVKKAKSELLSVESEVPESKPSKSKLSIKEI